MRIVRGIIYLELGVQSKEKPLTLLLTMVLLTIWFLLKLWKFSTCLWKNINNLINWVNGEATKVSNTCQVPLAIMGFMGRQKRSTLYVEAAKVSTLYGEDYMWCGWMDTTHLILGRPWKFDKDATYRGRLNQYIIQVGDKRVSLMPLPPKKVPKINEPITMKPE